MTSDFGGYTHESWVSRIGDSIKGVIFGVILFLASFVVLWLNEGRAVHTAEMLEEGGKSVISVSLTAPDAANDGKLIHFTGDSVGTPLTDDLFGLTQDAIKLQRSVEMYQWKETEGEKKKDTVGGGQTIAPPTYKPIWSSTLIDSTRFKNPAGHQNPAVMRVVAQTKVATEVKVGGFKLEPVLVNLMSNYTPVALTSQNLTQMPDQYKNDAALAADGTCVLSGNPGIIADPANPQIGDLKITETAVQKGPVSVMGRQLGALVDAYRTKKSGKELALVYTGTKTADEMIKSEMEKNAILTWILRLVGFVVMWIGLMLVLNPFKVLADVVGIIGDLVGMGLGLAALIVALCGSLLTIALAWLAYRPLVGGGLIAAAVVGLVLVKMMSKGRRSSNPVMAAPPAMPR